MIKHAMIVTLSALLSGEALAAIRMIQAAVVPLEQALGGSCLLGDACRKPAVAVILQNDDGWTSSPMWVRCQLFSAGVLLGTKYSQIGVLRANAIAVISIPDIPSNTAEARCEVEGGH
jgi:hypothetical protein